MEQEGGKKTATEALQQEQIRPDAIQFESMDMTQQLMSNQSGVFKVDQSVNIEPIEKHKATYLSEVANCEIPESSKQTEPQRISTLLKKYVQDQEQLNANMKSIEMQLLSISRENCQDAQQMQIKASSSSTYTRFREHKRKKTEATQMDQETRKDLSELRAQVDKLSSLIKLTNKAGQKKSESSTDQNASRLSNEFTDHSAEEELAEGSSNDTKSDRLEESRELLREYYQNKSRQKIITSNSTSLDKKDSATDNILSRKELTRPPKPKELTPQGVKILRDKYFTSSPVVLNFVTCSICHKVFDNLSYIEHRKTHKKPKLHTCVVCKQTFRLKHSLYKHMRSHPEFRPHKCKECPKSFASHHNLKQHMLYHTGQRSHMCSICGNTFWQSTHLKVHTMIHTGEAPYKCPECPKRFKTQSTMRKHVAVHSNVRPILCSECGKTFKLTQGLKQHMEKVHKRKEQNKINTQPLIQQAKIDETVQQIHNDFKIDSQQMEQPPMDHVVNGTYHYRINMQQREQPKLEEAVHPSYLEHPYLRFTDISNRTSNFFMPQEPAAFSFQHPQMSNRDVNVSNVFDKWE